MRRILLIALGVLISLSALVGVLAYVAVNTGAGRERVRRLALSSLRSVAHGTIDVKRIDGNLLGRFTLVGVSIADSARAPFFSADSVSARLSLAPLLRKRVELIGIQINRPHIVLVQGDSGAWNYQRIFPSGPATADTSHGIGDWILLRDVSLRDGDLAVVRPWTPTGSGRTRDSVIAVALSDSGRQIVARSGSGFTQRVNLSAINARVPLALLADPNARGMEIVVDSLAAIVAAFKPPVIDVRQLSGTLRIETDSMYVTPLHVLLPNTEARGSLVIRAASGDIATQLDIPKLAIADLRALYPALPDSGTGAMHLDMTLRDSLPSVYAVRGLQLAVGAARASGRFGLTLGDSLTQFDETDIEFRALPTSLITQLAPAVKSPVPAVLEGHAVLSGPLTRMQLAVDAVVAPRRYAAFTIGARGIAGIGESVLLENLAFHGDRVPLSLARAFDASSPIGGVVTANGVVSGSSAGRLSGRVAIVHAEKGLTSRASLRGSVAMNDQHRMNVDADIQTLALALLNELTDSLNVRGAVSGSAHLEGTTRDLQGRVALQLPDSGHLSGTGTYRVGRDDTASYTAEVRLRNVAPQAIVPSLPLMLVDGSSTLEGRGTALEQLNARVSSRFGLFMVDSAELRDVVVEARADRGLLHVDSLYGNTGFAAVRARGSFGLAAGHPGRLTFDGRVDDLKGLTRWIGSGDTTAVPARPATNVRLASIRRRIDSLRAAENASRDPAAQLAQAMRESETNVRASAARRAVPTAPPLRRDSTGGSFTVSGEIAGDLKRANASARLKTPGIVWNGNLIGAGTVDGAWREAFTASDTVIVDAALDSLTAAGFAFDSTRVHATYRGGAGVASVRLFPGDTSYYRLDADYALRKGGGELFMRDVRLQLDTTSWRSVGTSAVRWRGRALTVDSFDLRDAKHDARIFVHGALPGDSAGHIELVAERVRIAPWLAIAQSDVKADGLVSARMAMQGTSARPTLDGTVAVTKAEYDSTAFPDVAATLRYNDLSLRIDANATNSAGVSLATVAGTLPLNLTFADSVAERLPNDGALALRVTGDSIPLAPLADMTAAVTDVRGSAQANVSVGGSWKSPKLGGTAGVALSQLRLASTGVMMHDVRGGVHLGGDSVHVDSLVAHSDGVIRGSGSIALTPITSPRLDLSVQANGARVLDDERGELFANGDLRIVGPLDSMRVTGSTAITRGVIYIPDPQKLKVISTEDPILFSVTDSATARQLGVAPPSAMMQNLRLDLNVDVQRGVFGRSAAANIEAFGKLRVRLEPPGDAFQINGALQTDQGTYTLFSKRFDVTRGSVRFVGAEDLNPSLQIIATYEVRQAGRAPLEIRVVIGGTLERPTVSLESDAQPTLSQSDLLAFLAFGRSSSSLLQFSGSGIEGGGAGGSSLAGNVAALATRQLAGIGLGALVDEVRADLATATGADLLNITPAPLPADVSLGGAQTLIRGTEIEIGRYLNNRTFVIGRVRPTLAVPGATLDHRIGDRLRARLSLETRYQATQPSLSLGVEPKTLQVLGTLLTWTIVW